MNMVFVEAKLLFYSSSMACWNTSTLSSTFSILTAANILCKTLTFSYNPANDVLQNRVLFFLNFNEVSRAVLAYRAYEIRRQRFALIHIAANSTAITCFLSGLRFWLDMSLIVRVGEAFGLSQNLTVYDLGSEHGVGAEINSVRYGKRQVRVDVFSQVDKAVIASREALVVGEFVSIRAGLEAEILEHFKRGFRRQG